MAGYRLQEIIKNKSGDFATNDIKKYTLLLPTN